MKPCVVVVVDSTWNLFSTPVTLTSPSVQGLAATETLRPGPVEKVLAVTVPPTPRPVAPAFFVKGTGM